MMQVNKSKKITVAIYIFMLLDGDTTYSWHEKNINTYVFTFYYKKFDDI